MPFCVAPRDAFGPLRPARDRTARSTTPIRERRTSAGSGGRCGRSTNRAGCGSPRATIASWVDPDRGSSAPEDLRARGPAALLRLDDTGHPLLDGGLAKLFTVTAVGRLGFEIPDPPVGLGEFAFEMGDVVCQGGDLVFGH